MGGLQNYYRIVYGGGMKRFILVLFNLLFSQFLFASFGKYDFYRRDTHIGRVTFYEFNEKKYFDLNELTKVLRIKKDIYPVSFKIVLHFDNKNLVIYRNLVDLDGVIKTSSTSSPIILRGSKYFVNSEIFVLPDFAKIFEIKFDIDDKNKIVVVYTDINVTSVKYFSYIEKTRVIVYMSKPLKYSSEIFGKKIVVDIDNGVYVMPSDNIMVGDGKVDNINVIQSKRGLKIVIETGEVFSGEYETSVLTDPDRIIIDLKGKKDEEMKRIDVPEQNKVPVLLPTTSTFVLPDKIKKNEKMVVIIDPGHGGKDPGGNIVFGKREKQINLEIGKKLYDIMKKDDRFETYITRDDDKFIPLYERSKYANDKRCDLFISIHSNAHKNRKENGFEIYFLSEKATDPWASEVEEYENASIEYEGGVFDYTPAAIVLHSLARNEYINEGSKLAAYVAKYMQKETPFINRGVKQAAFYVLRGTYCPGILIEVGFMTNKKDKKNLDDPKVQKKIANAIYKGIVEYEKNAR
jgi:N-acetylmuramoyl-L-alanine amidase